MEDKHNKKLGEKGERRAVRYLKRKGYKILERNYRSPFGEVDVIAKRGEYIAFCEVKTRLSDDFGSPREAVDEARRRRYRLAAELYARKDYYDCVVRFDVIEVCKDGLNHIENAF